MIASQAKPYLPANRRPPHLEPVGMEAAAEGRALTRRAQQAGKYTDTASFTIRCLVCQRGLTGEKEAVEHAKATGHTNFSEFK